MVNVTKYYKHGKEPELYHYFNASNEKLWMFRHRYYDALGKRREKSKSGFKTDKAALKALLQVKASLLNGQTKHIENENLTVGDWLDLWYEMNHKKWKENTRIQRQNAINLHLKPLIGRCKLQNLDRAMYQRDFINVLEGKYSARSIHIWHSIFTIAINAAVEEEILLRNKFRKVVLPIVEGHEELQDNFLNESQLNLLLHDIKENEDITAYTLFLTLAYTGMRKGEALGLQWKNVDFDNHTITIERTRDDKTINSPKTKNSLRKILIDDVVINQLGTYMAWCKKRMFRYGQKIKDDSFVFISKYGAVPIFPRKTNDILNRSLERTKLHKITPHGLRHTHATILLNRGLEVKLIAERLGNSTDMIYKVYGHILKDLEKEAVKIFSQSLAVAKEK
ncbi:site-specific integrase [Ureibacillus sp. Re31]|uniref:Site-specific integrase n=1 Tax=Ureibacillus galli TaxID=2762222 RepID=A0ABR8X8C6_9BACL|nr:tyrosine-type recombinase/integrase [Ureibacillus galli]MBD8025565.1 site-specific integrase [Ureibacillus galli]